MINLSPTEKSSIVGRFFYIHNCALPLYTGILSWFTNCLYNKFNFKTISTYEKFIKELRDESGECTNNEEGNPIYKPKLPAISLDPMGDVDIDERWAQLWHFGWIEGGANWASTLFQDLTPYKAEWFRMAIIPTRFIGTMECTIAIDSPTKLIDLYFATRMFFGGGFNRPIRPSFIEADVIVPTELMEDVFYNNEYTGVNDMNIQFDNPDHINHKIIKQLGGDEYYYIPIELDPQIRLQSISGSSEKHGGNDLAKWSYTFSFSYEVNIPTFFYLETDWKLDVTEKNLYMYNDSVRYADDNSTFTDDYFDPKNIPDLYSPNYMISSDSNDCQSKHLYHFRTFRHTEETGGAGPWTFTFLPDEGITEYEKIVIIISNGFKLEQGKDFTIDGSDNIIITIPLETGNKLYFHIYQKKGKITT